MIQNTDKEREDVGYRKINNKDGNKAANYKATDYAKVI